MSNPLEGKKLFVHWPLQGLEFSIPYFYGLVTVSDPLVPGQLPIQRRYEDAGADIALIDTFSFVFDKHNDLLGSGILQARAVCVLENIPDRQVQEFNNRLIDQGFITIFINEVSKKPLMSRLFLKALANATATS